MTALLLARHGVTDWNLEHRVQGHTDQPLNAEGVTQAHALAEALRQEPLVAIYSSDLSRARDTAAVVAAAHGLEVELDVDLREKNFGSWEGLTDAEIRVRHPDAVRGAWGDGESADDLSRRAVSALDRILSARPHGAVLVISHGGTLRAILSHLGVPHSTIGNCEVFRA